MLLINHHFGVNLGTESPDKIAGQDRSTKSLVKFAFPVPANRREAQTGQQGGSGN
jgi:hypothetical protein